jgi:hypothetical protein
MVCASCGTNTTPGGRFCPHCGASFGAPSPAQPPYPTPMPYMPPFLSRVRQNLQTLGILWVAYGVLRLSTGMFFLWTFAFRPHRFVFRPHYISMFNTGFPWSGAMLPLVGTATVVGVTVALFVGFSLLNRKPWGRTLGIIAGILSLFTFPVGTALGIYTLWVLAPARSGFEYDSIADRS